jgi:hypothetical protein
MINSMHLKEIVDRVVFNPMLPAHLESLYVFLETGKWGKVQFFPENPCITVPETVLRKYCLFNLSRKFKGKIEAMKAQ